MRPAPLLILFAAGALTLGSAVHAQSYRCRNELISVGDSMESVQRKCGEPVSRDRACEPGPIVNGIAACFNVERWTYRPGYGEFVTILRFDEDGNLAGISYGDRQ